MLFNSVEFLIFAPLVFILYWFVFNRNLKIQNILLLVASYIFYGWWDWRFLSLIFISSITDYILGIQIDKTTSKKKRALFLIISLCVNLGFLGYFKYYNFFVDSFVDLMNSIGLQANRSSLNIILPVGISFYTFQTLSYTLDIYNGKLKHTKDFIAFFTFVSFFPQLVAGPIERAKNLLPQFHKPRTFDYTKSIDGLRQMLWGFFKKVVVADTCASNVDYIFSNYDSLQGSVLVLGAVFFAFQIYGDFSGYSDIAIGTARLFGFNLMQNFAFPYFSRDIAEFWRRWHISLSSWFRDYLYIPLGGSRGTKLKRIRNIVLTFTISGFWHGANWTYIIWGFLNGIYYIPLMLLNKQKSHKEIVAFNRKMPKPIDILNILITFMLTILAWIFFRAKNISHAFHYLGRLFTHDLFHISIVNLRGRGITSTLIDGSIAIIILVIAEWINRRKQHALEDLKVHKIIRWSVYIILTFIVLLYFGEEKTFIYFQF